jgi:hypothetical protein
VVYVRCELRPCLGSLRSLTGEADRVVRPRHGALQLIPGRVLD